MPVELVPDAGDVAGEHLDPALAHGLSTDHLLEGVEQQVLPLGLSLDLVEDEGQVLGQVAQGDVPEGVAGSRLDLLTGMVEGVAEVGAAADLSDSEEAEGEEQVGVAETMAGM